MMPDSLFTFTQIPFRDTLSVHVANHSFVDNMLYDFYQKPDSLSTLQKTSVDSFSFFSQGIHHINVLPKQDVPFEWFFVFTCLVVLCIAILKLFLGSKSFIRMDYFIKRKNSFTGFGLVLFWFLVYVCILVVAVLFVCYSVQFKFVIPFSFKIYAQIFLLTILYFFMHVIAIDVSGLLFALYSEIGQYKDLNNYFRFLTSIFILPFLFVGYCYPSIYWLIPILLIMIGLYLLKLVQAWTIFRKKVAWHEFFLYLCSIEILPLAVLVKFLISRFLVK